MVTSTVDPVLPLGRELRDFVDAAVLGDAHELPPARAALSAVSGPDVVRTAAAVTANFQMMNRLLDAIGGPVDPVFVGLAADLGVEVPTRLRTDRQ